MIKKTEVRDTLRNLISVLAGQIEREGTNLSYWEKLSELDRQLSNLLGVNITNDLIQDKWTMAFSMGEEKIFITLPTNIFH